MDQYKVHLAHCNMGEHLGVCKYGDPDCPAIEHAKTKAKMDKVSMLGEYVTHTRALNVHMQDLFEDGNRE